MNSKHGSVRKKSALALIVIMVLVLVLGLIAIARIGSSINGGINSDMAKSSVLQPLSPSEQNTINDFYNGLAKSPMMNPGLTIIPGGIEIK
jgi:hypothetical protein